MRSARASRCSNRAQWIGCPSASAWTAAVLRERRHRVIAVAAARPRAAAMAVVEASRVAATRGVN